MVNDLLTTELTTLVRTAASNTSLALSKLVHKPVVVESVDAGIRPVTELVRPIGPEEMVVGVCLPFTGDAGGVSLVAFREDAALILSDLLAKREPGTARQLSVLDASALKEVGNILVGVYLTALANRANVRLVESVPSLRRDMFGAIVSHIAAGLAQEATQALVIEIKFSFGQPVFSGHLVIFFRAEDGERLVPSQSLLREGARRST